MYPPSTLTPNLFMKTTVSILLLELAAGCGGNLSVAEDRNSASAGGAPSALPAMAGSGGAASGSAGTTAATIPIVHNDPCNEAGILRFSFSLPSGGHPVSARAYIVGFDPPGVVGSVPLVVDDFGPLSGSMDSRALTGSPDCTFLRSAALFAVFTYENGATETTDTYLDSSFTGNFPFSCEFRIRVESPRPDRVRVFGMSPGSDVLEGPVPFVGTGGSWTGQATALDLPSCAQQNYVYILAAHHGGELVGLQTFSQSSL